MALQNARTHAPHRGYTDFTDTAGEVLAPGTSRGKAKNSCFRSFGLARLHVGTGGSSPRSKSDSCILRFLGAGAS